MFRHIPFNMEKLRILFVTSEINPFLKISSAADFVRMLPQGLHERGHEIRILMPKFGVINERRNRLHEVVRLSGINIRVGNEEKPLTIKVASIPNVRLQVYFLDNEDYFQRKSVLFDNNDTFHPDNDERAIFFCKGAIETVKKLGWTPNIIHCHDWMTSLIPLYVKTHYKDDPVFQNSKVVFTVYNNAFNERFPASFVEKARLDGIPHETLHDFAENSYYGVTKGGMRMADAITFGQNAIDPHIQAFLDDTNIQPRHVRADAPDYIERYQQLYHAILN